MPHFKHGHQRDPEQLGVTLGWQSAEYVLDNSMLKVNFKNAISTCHPSFYKISKPLFAHTQSGSALPLKGFHYIPTAKPPFFDWWQQWRCRFAGSSFPGLVEEIGQGPSECLGGRFPLMRQSHRPKRCSHFKKVLGAVSHLSGLEGRDMFRHTFVLDVFW